MLESNILQLYQTTLLIILHIHFLLMFELEELENDKLLQYYLKLEVNLNLMLKLDDKILKLEYISQYFHKLIQYYKGYNYDHMDLLQPEVLHIIL